MGRGPERIFDSGLKGLFSRLGIELKVRKWPLTIRSQLRSIPRFSSLVKSPSASAPAVKRESSPLCCQEIAMLRLER